MLEFTDSDDKNVDMYFMGMYNINYINPSTRFGRKAINSFSRFSSEENDKLLENIISKKGVEDENYRIKANKKWQEYYSEQLPIVPLMYVYEVYLVNRRIKKVTSEMDISDLELTAPEPIKNK
ncbi:MAG: hypothetical protein Q4D53_06055 [Leptotrichiaceae bacterium]|nr:hypothetical protein [Leptotrichiaceae bacterium]